MGHAVQGDVVVGSAANGWTACLYHLYYFLNTWLPANYPNRISIVEAYAGSGGAWTDQTTVTDDAFIVVQMADEWPDTTQWQAVFAVRDANSAGTLGGTAGAVAIPNDGMWCGIAPQGGWVTADRNFGSSPFSLMRHIQGRGLDSSGIALSADTLMNFGYMDRVDSAGLIDNGALFVHQRVSGTYTGSFIVGAFTPFNDARLFPCMVVAGTPDPTSGSNYYGATTGAGSVPNNADPTDPFELALSDSGVALDTKLLDETGANVGYPIIWANQTQLKALGWFDGLTRIDTATVQGSTFDTGMKWACTKIAWPWGVDAPTV